MKPWYDGYDVICYTYTVDSDMFADGRCLHHL